MKILLVHNFYNMKINSGENNVVENELNLLRNSGHEVLLYSQINEPNQKFSKVELFEMGIRFISGSGSSEEIIQILQREKFDVCHIHNIFPLIGSQVISQIHEAQIPIVQTIHNFRYRCGAGVNSRNGKVCLDCSKNFGKIQLIVHKCYRDSYVQSAAMYFAQSKYVEKMKLVSIFIVLSAYAKQEIIKFGIPENAIRIKQNFANRNIFPQKKFSKSVVYAGRLEKEKGVQLLLKSWIESNASQFGWTLKIAGAGSLEGEVEELARNSKGVQYLGLLSKSQLAQEITDCSFSIITSQMLENCPMQIVESLAVSTPVIFRPNESTNGFMNPSFSISLPENTENWKFIFDKLDSFDCIELSVAARAEYEEKYSPEVSLASLEEIYRRVQFPEEES